MLNPRKKNPMIIWGGMVFYITLKGWELGFKFITKGSLGYLSSMYFSTSLVLGEVAVPFPQIENWESRTET